MNMINQMVELMYAGRVIGGAHADQPKDEAVLYYCKDGEFFVGNASNGGPSAVDERISEGELRRRLEAHLNSISEEDADKDKQMIEAAAVEPVSTTVKAHTIFGEPVPVMMIPVNQAYALLHLLDEMSMAVWVEDTEEEYAAVIEAARNLYANLPRGMQKDIQELDIFTLMEV